LGSTIGQPKTVEEKVMSQIAELIKYSDDDIIELLKRVDLETEEKFHDAAYRELTRRYAERNTEYVKKAAKRVIWAAIITASATVLVQLLGLIATG
jgi:hypothetical protein